MSDLGSIRYLFTGRVEERDGSYVVEIPEREIEEGTLEPGQESKIGLFAAAESGGTSTEETAETTDAVTDAGDQEGSTRESSGDGAGDGAAHGGGDAGGGESASARDEGGSGGGGANAMGDLDEVSLDEQEPPVSEGDTRHVEIEDEGEQGDGLARIDRGYIVFVPDTEPGDTVEIEITDTKENFGFGKIVE